jgi:hypothetical protein
MDMIIDTENPNSVVLQVLPQNLNGTPKTSLIGASVRVYHINDSGLEIEDLADTVIIQVPSSYAWRYLWEPILLAPDHYFAEYILIDVDNITAVFVEDIIIMQKCPTVEEIDQELTTNHGIGSWVVKGKSKIIPG